MTAAAPGVGAEKAGSVWDAGGLQGGAQLHPRCLRRVVGIRVGKAEVSRSEAVSLGQPEGCQVRNKLGGGGRARVGGGVN